MSRITIIVFDMFNTLVQDGETFWLSSFQRIVQEQGLDISPPHLREEWAWGDRHFRESRAREGVPFQSYGDAWGKGFSRTFSDLKLAGDPQGALRIVVEDMVNRPLYGDTRDALLEIQQNWRVAVLSNADDNFLHPVVERLGFPFELVLSSQGARCYKPRPQLFLEALRRLGVSPEQAAYVGDRQLEDVQGARRAGMRAVWINRDNLAPDPHLPGPHHLVTSLREIPQILGPMA
jgi:2-haloacid dehalogenase